MAKLLTVVNVSPKAPLNVLSTPAPGGGALG